MREARTVVATTDFHSAFDRGLGLLDRLAAERARGGLLVDSGDFFQGTGYYQLGGGRLEEQVLTRLYDAVAPGNHGFAHHQEPALAAITVCCNLTGPTGAWPFATHQLRKLAGRWVLLTGVLGEQAFSTIPPDERREIACQPPGVALARLWVTHGDRADALLVLSHAGWVHDHSILAPALAGLGVPVLVLAGHCHSPEAGPTTLGRVLLAKAPECGAGWVQATLARDGAWKAAIHRAPAAPHEPLAPAVAGLARAVPTLPAGLAQLRGRLAQQLGPVAGGWRGALDRGRLAHHLAQRLLARTDADIAVVNVWALRERRLGGVLTVADLLAIEPFDNQVGVWDADGAALEAWLTASTTEPVRFAGYLAPGRLRLATTRYLVTTSLADVPTQRAGGTTYPLRDAVREVLLALPPPGGA